MFYAFRTQVKGTEPVHAFWHDWHAEHTFHLGKPWKGEVQKEVQFYAFRKDPSLFANGRIKTHVKKLEIQNICATASTYLASIHLVVADMNYDNFSDEFAVHG